MKLYLLLGHIFFVNFLVFNQVSTATDKVICYYDVGSIGTFTPEGIDVSICTHINFAYLGINEDGSLRLDNSDDILRRLSDLKSINPNIKLLLSVGGWFESSLKFSNVAADAGKKATMAESTLLYLEIFNFDGIDIVWQYPGKRGGRPSDKENFIDMLWVLRNKFNENGGYLITIGVSSTPDGSSYDVNAISRVVDAINVMTYDFNYEAGKTVQNSPLYASSTDSDWERQYSNCDAAINNWINGGADPAKIVMGLAFFGRSFTLADPNNHGVGAPVVVDEGSDTGSYDYICDLINGWTEVWNDEQQVPYKYSGNQWIGYDNPRSIGLKVHYAKSHNLAGVMMWTVDRDDKDGSCGVHNALLQTIKINL